jgi:hypothetical protein
MIKPDREDYARIEKEYGPLPANATDGETAERYRLAQAAKIIREAGLPPGQERKLAAKAK